MRICDILKEENMGKKYVYENEEYKVVYNNEKNIIDLVNSNGVTIFDLEEPIDLFVADFEDLVKDEDKVEIIFENCERLIIDKKYLEVYVEGNLGKIEITIKDYKNSLDGVRTTYKANAINRLKEWGDITFIKFSNEGQLIIPWEEDDSFYTCYEHADGNGYQYYQEGKKDFKIIIDRIKTIENKIESLNNEIEHYENILINIKGE